jgi:acetyltransferase-like isoleucine patch superfamily enzyme
VSLGDGVVIHSFTHIFGDGGVTIGHRTMISASCSITSLTHPEPVALREELLKAPVIIGDDCWLGTGAIVLPGVTIGNGSIVAAGAIVTRDVPENVVVAGSPARILRPIRS